MKTSDNSFLSMLHRAGIKCHFAGVVPDSDIVAFEREFKISIPSDFRGFMSSYGCGSIGSIEIYGLGIEPVGVPSLPWLLNELESLGSKPPIDILPFSPLGDGTYAALACKKIGPFNVGTVIRWSPSMHDVSRLEVLGSDFNSYVLDLVDTLSG